MKPYSLDLRQKIVDSYENNEGAIRQLAKRFKVSPDCVRRLLKRFYEEGTIEPKSYSGGNQPLLQPEHLKVLTTLVEEDNDATLPQLAQRLEAQTNLGAMTLEKGFLTGLSFEGGTNGELFLWFIEEILVPQLWAGAVVVMDNLPAHKVQGVREALASVGARLVYLSPYSPDFNPIENLWSKLKSHLRSVEARTREALHDAIRDGLQLITLKDIRNWFTHCCYCT